MIDWSRIRQAFGGHDSLAAQARQGQAAIDALETREHAKWGRFLHDKEGDLLREVEAEQNRRISPAPPVEAA